MSLIVVVVALLGAFEPQPLLPDAPYILQGHTDTLTAVAFSPDSKRVASASRDRTVRVWSLETGASLHAYALGEKQISSLSFSADGALIALGDVGFQVRVFETETGTVRTTIAHPDVVTQVSLHGKWLAVATAQDLGAVYEWETKKKIFEFPGRTAQFSADGSVLLISSGLGKWVLYETKTWKVKKQVSTSPDLPLTTMTPGAKHIVSWTAAGAELKLWSPDGKQVGAPLKTDSTERITDVAFVAGGQTLVAGSGDGVVRLWDLGKRTVIRRWSAPRQSSLAVSPDGTWLAVLDQGLVKLWKL